MYIAGKNLLYTFHRSLTAQHVTVAAFKHYARSPEDRTFRKYFRKTNPFTKYMRQRPENSLSRYITKHRRKKSSPPAKGEYPKGGRGCNSFTTRITTTILETLQTLRIHYPAPTGRDVAGVTTDPGRCPGLNYTAPSVRVCSERAPSVRQQDGLKGRCTIAQPIGLSPDTPTHPNRPEGAAYSPSNNLCEPRCSLRQNKKTKNKPISMERGRATIPARPPQIGENYLKLEVLALILLHKLVENNKIWLLNVKKHTNLGE